MQYQNNHEGGKGLFRMDNEQDVSASNRPGLWRHVAGVVAEWGVAPRRSLDFAREQLARHAQGRAPMAPSLPTGFEPLESRVLLSGAIEGTVFFDLNFNGVLDDAGESGRADRVVYVDADQDGERDVSELFATTNSQGEYRIDGVAAGTHQVRLEPVDNWIETTPGEPNFFHEITLATDQVLAGVNFGVVFGGNISGTVFSDTDLDGQLDTGENGVNGVTVRLYDAETNELVETTVTATVNSAEGTYAFETLLPTDYRVEIDAPSGMVQTTFRFDGGDRINMIGGQENDNPGVNFGIIDAASASGTIWNDANEDGVLGGGEALLANWRAYIDANDNGQFDSAGTVNQLFSYQGSALTLPDGGSAVQAPIDVAGLHGLISDLNVSVNIEHTFVGDLMLTLIAPDGTQIVLSNRNGAGEDGFLGTTFDDEAAENIGSAPGPYTGSYQPRESLGDLIGSDPEGTWTLQVRDAQGTETGQLVSWTLDITIDQEAEPNDLTDGSGQYTIPNIVPGAHEVNVDAPLGWTVQFPTVDGDHDVVLTAGEVETNLNFGVSEADALVVTNFNSNASGFVATFSGDIDPLLLNLYDGNDAEIDLPDVIVAGDSTGPVDGSLVWDESSNALRFVATGGVLAPDTYTVTMRGDADALVDLSGVPLDGDDNGTAGGDFVTQFTVTADSARVLSLPDIARGPDQAIDISTAEGGLPVSIDDASGVTSVSMTINYDPDLITVNGASLGAEVPGDWQLTTNTSTAGEVTLTLSGSALSAGAMDLVRLNASVPLSATYRASQVLTIDNITINGGAINAIGDSAVHKVAYVGDASGNQGYSPLDANLIARVSVGLDSGYDNFATIDPAIMGDVTGNGSLSPLDASFIARKSVGLTVPEIPDLPASASPTLAFGPDPIIEVTPTDTTPDPGDTVPVALVVTDTANGMSSARLVVQYDTDVFDVANSDVSLGELNSTGWGLSANVNEAAGEIVIGIFSFGEPLGDVTGSVAEIDFHVRSDAPGGATTIDLLDEEDSSVFDGNGSNIDEGALQLTPIDSELTVSGATGPGSISGFKFEDVDGDGAFDTGEPALQNWTIYLDANGNNTLDTGEESVVTGVDGSYSFTDLTAGSYVVREVAQVGWDQSAPTDGEFSFNLGAGQDLVNRNFGNYQPGTISGVVFEDVDGDGAQDAGEPGVADWQVFIDENLDGQFDTGEATMQTDVDGSFSFTGLAPGSYRINQVLQDDFVVTDPIPAIYTEVIESGEVFAAADFGIQVDENGSISGVKYNDLNGDGTRDLGEPGLENWTIFLDTNANGELDTGETSTQTAADGSYSFTSLVAGNYNVVEVEQTGWLQTEPGTGSHTVTVSISEDVTGVNFGNQLVSNDLGSISGVKFNDLDGDGVRDGGEPGLQNWTIYLDENGNNDLDTGERFVVTEADGSYLFDDLAADTYVVREVLEAGWVQSGPAGGEHSFTLTAGVNATNRNFANYQPATISGLKYNDLNGDGDRDTGEAGLSGWTIYLDTNTNGQLDTGETSTVTLADGSYSFSSLAPGSYTIAEVQQVGWTQTAPATDNYSVTLVSGDDITNRDFGNEQSVVEGEVTLDVGVVAGAPGETVTIPVTLTGDTNGVGGISITINYDTNRLDITDQDISLGSLVSTGWSLVTNVNDAAGTISVALFATGDSLDGSTGRLLNIDANIAANAALGLAQVDIEAEVNEGTVTVIDDDGGVNVALATGEVIASTATSPRGVITFTEDDGTTVRIRLIGSGEASLVDDGQGGIDLVLTGTDIRSRLIVSTDRGGDGRFDVDDLTADSDLGQIISRTTDYGGDIDIDGTLSLGFFGNIENGDQSQLTIGSSTNDRASVVLMFDRVTDLSITSETDIRVLRATDWQDTNGTNDVLMAPSVFVLQTTGDRRNNVDGDFEADLNLTDDGVSLRVARIAGDVTGDWQLAGDATAILAGRMIGVNINSGGSIRSVRVIDWQGGGITADELGVLQTTGDRRNNIAGDFDANLQLTSTTARAALGRAIVAGQIGGNWDIASHVQAITARGGTAADWSLDVEGDVAVINGGTGDVGGTIEASTIRVLQTRGDFTANVTAQGTTGPQARSIAVVNVGRAQGANITAAGNVNSVIASEWQGGSINVGSLNVLRTTGNPRAQVDGDFTGNLIIGDEQEIGLRSALIAGGLNDALIRSESSIGAIIASEVQNTLILLGVDPSFTTTLGLLPDSPDDFLSQETLGRLIIRGRADGAQFVDSAVAAWEIGTAILGEVDTTNAELFGLSAAAYGRVLATDADAGGRLVALNTLGNPGVVDAMGDFRLVLIDS